NMNPSRQDGFIVAQGRSFLKPRRSGKSGTSQIVSFEHAKASAALAASCKRACGNYQERPARRVCKQEVIRFHSGELKSPPEFTAASLEFPAFTEQGLSGRKTQVFRSP